MATDQILGIVYGALKSMLIFGFVYAASINLHSSIYGVSSKAKLREKMPSWLYEAKTRPIIAPFANAIDPVASSLVDESQDRFLGQKIKKSKPEGAEKRKVKFIKSEDSSPLQIYKKGRGKPKQVEEDVESFRIYEKVKKNSEKFQDKGYSKKEIEKMDRLIEIVE